MHSVKLRLAFLAGIILPAAIAAQNVNPTPEMNYERLMRMELRVIKEDITDHPYRVLAEIEADAAQVTRFSKRPTNEKLAKELWDEARKINADAVLNASFSDLETTGLTYGRRRAYGQAVKFLSNAEVEVLRGN